MLPREARKTEYREKLKERFKEAKDVKRIARHRSAPTNANNPEALRCERRGTDDHEKL